MLLTCSVTFHLGFAPTGMSQVNTEITQGPCIRLAQCRIPTITGFLKVFSLGPHITAGLNCAWPSEKSINFAFNVKSRFIR